MEICKQMENKNIYSFCPIVNTQRREAGKEGFNKGIGKVFVCVCVCLS